ncbi:MAG: hypothetical protein OEW77_07385 [Gemmatimonadota bacterium]|nr:hypothetical protein [Gemmatimonadota bacterium]
MRSTRAMRWGVGAAVVAVVAACGDAVGPPGSAGAGRDLEFAVPVGAMVLSHTQDTLSRAATPIGAASALDDAGGVWTTPRVDDYWLRAWFSGSVLVLEYGLRGVGTGYTISPSVSVVGANSQPIPISEVKGLEEDTGILMYFEPSGREQWDTRSTCGASASANANFTIRVSLPMLSKYAAWSLTEQSTARANQAPCAPPPAPTAGGEEIRGDELYLCWYNVWVDSLGRVVEYEELYCEKIGGIEM